MECVGGWSFGYTRRSSGVLSCLGCRRSREGRGVLYSMYRVMPTARGRRCVLFSLCLYRPWALSLSPSPSIYLSLSCVEDVEYVCIYYLS